MGGDRKLIYLAMDGICYLGHSMELSYRININLPNSVGIVLRGEEQGGVMD